MLTESLKSLARGARYLPDRLLHSWHRQSAGRRLTQLRRPSTVLFVCQGNIRRSPYAAGVARGLLSATIAFESAGFIGPNRPSPPEAVAVAAEGGIDLSPHCSQLIELDHVREVDLVVVMDSQQRHRLVSSRQELGSRVFLLGDLDPEPITRRTVLDPVEQPAEVFRSCYDRIDRCVRALAALCRAPGGDDAQGQGGKLE